MLIFLEKAWKWYTDVNAVSFKRDIRNIHEFGYIAHENPRSKKKY